MKVQLEELREKGPIALQKLQERARKGAMVTATMTVRAPQRYAKVCKRGYHSHFTCDRMTIESLRLAQY
jgi:hypothetical protein